MLADEKRLCYKCEINQIGKVSEYGADELTPPLSGGGKSCLFWLTADVLRLNRLERGHYAEPYAGGAGLALSLLYGGHVADIHINDLDRSIWSFWHCVLNDTGKLISKIENTPVTVEEWARQREIHRNEKFVSKLDLAFATFFLNRTNRSGIIKSGGMIGGVNQKGSYKVDCRFNVPDLVRRVARIRKYDDRIHLTNLDALEFMEMCDRRLPQNSLMFVDPPYYNKGAELYANYYSKDDHIEVATTVSNLERPWIVTYDDDPAIRMMYKDKRQYLLDISYSAAEKRRGTELFVASKGLKVTNQIRDRQINKPQYRTA